ncbi:MAG: hypothetical protein CL609_10135 [Anaerolineaceae bacterium]|nr:hypothetical protein [Anaerolineaceae bacterium]
MIKIVTDSTCDLPIDIIQAYDITVIPCYVNMNGKSYLDGVELSRVSFFEQLPDADPLPTTSAPGIGSFINAYNDLASQGASGIISIHISKTLSNIVNIAKIASENFDAVPVRVIDSGQLSMGLGLLALTGAKKALNGGTLDEVVSHIEQKIPLTNSFAKLDTLDYLKKGGRLSDLQHSIVSLLDMKPITKMNNGESGLELVRTRKKAHLRFLEIAKNLGSAEMLGIIHANVPDLAEQVRLELKQIWPGVDPMISFVTPAIGAHVGPGTVCISSIQTTIENPLIDSRVKNLKEKVSAVTSLISRKN